MIDIDDKIRRELARFPRLDFLEHAFDDHFKQIEETIRLVVAEFIGDFPINITVGRYMKKLALLRFARERQPIISKCIEEIRQYLEKYNCIPK